MTKHDFKVGDVVRVVDCKCILPLDAEFKITENNNCHVWGSVTGCIEIGYVENYPSEFILIERVEENVDGTVNVMITVNTGDEPEGMDDFIETVRENMAAAIATQPSGFLGGPFPGAYLSIPDTAPTIVETNLEDIPRHEPEPLGVYRPDLNTRKVGKVGMHMFIDGFPNAMYEVARVMQWAADNKGYKLHDWKNLPEAELALSSAGYRHMVDNAVQRADGIEPKDRVDHESNLLHLAHQAFNILAQIELIKTGKIQ